MINTGPWRLLLVDDEPNIREGLRDLVDWSSLGIQIVGEAESGMEALRKAFRLSPHIVLVDIVMPDHDGIWLARRLKEHNRSTRVVFLSAYRQSDYLLEAFRLGADYYMVKPFDDNEFTQVMSKIVADLQSDLRDERREDRYRRQLERNQDLLAERFLRDIMYGRSGVSASGDIEKRFDCSDSSENSQLRFMFVHLAEAGAGQAIASIEDRLASYSTAKPSLVSESSNLVIVHRGTPETWATIESQTTSVLHDLGSRAFTAVSEPAESVLALRDFYARAARQAAARESSVGDQTDAREPVTIVGIPSLKTPDDGGGSRYRQVVREVVDLIETNYMDESISLSTIAEAVQLSPNYLSTLFKREVGLTLYRFILDTRLRHAKRLLKNPRYRTYEVAFAVGYANANHFSKVFRRETTMTPGQYRESGR